MTFGEQTFLLRLKVFRRRQSSMNGAAWLLLCVTAVGVSGCETFAKKESTGAVTARRAQIRSSTAVVAADLLAVERGDMVDILEATTTENGEQWLRVRADDTEGWIESRNIMSEELLDRSRRLASEDENTPTQATGQLRANTNLRLSPDRNADDNILMKLDAGVEFDIVGWKYVPKPRTSEAAESDDAPKPGAARRGGRRGDIEAPKVPEDSNELWYKVRLPLATPPISPAPAGWIFGKQVELTVPSDIIFYRTGREFVAWQRLDNDGVNGVPSVSKNKETTSDTQPGSWVILEKSSSSDSTTADQVDFDRIYVLGYDKNKQEHYTAYRSPDVRGRLPLRVEERNGGKIFTVRFIKDDGQEHEAAFKVFRNERGSLKIESISVIPKNKKK
ncbi:MAG: hypothetical protein H0T92_05770 [Pyrinomonadaceae bacterium]|nr:hypothetical protein [Pyrinomonadaceae bacterium]